MQCWQYFAEQAFLGTHLLELIDTLFLGLDLAPAKAALSLPLALADSARFLFITCSISIFSKSENNSLRDFGRVEWIRFY